MNDRELHPLSEEALRMVRISALLLGVVLVLVSLLANRIGLSAYAEAGRGQIITGCIGCFLLVGGLLGRHFPRFHAVLAVTLFSAFLAFMILELLGSAWLLWRMDSADGNRFVLRFRDAPGTVHAPYVGWQNRTPRIVPEPGLLLFGGSELALPENADPPSTVAFLLDSLRTADGKGGISDYSQPHYSAAQSLVTLLLQLRDGVRSPEVLLVCGPGDVLAALSTGDPIIPVGTDIFRSLTWTGREEPVALRELRERAIRRNTPRLAISVLLNAEEEEETFFDPYLGLADRSDPALDSLAATIANRIGISCKILEALGNEFDFEVRVVWIGLRTDTDSHVCFDLHARTDPLIQSLADSIPCLNVVELESEALPGDPGSVYSGLSDAQANTLARLLY